MTTGSTSESGALEAESATLSGGAVVAADHAGYTGSGFVGGYTDGNRGTAKTTFSVTATGATNLALRYANGSGVAQTLSLLADGVKVRQISLPTTANWDTWATATETVTLPAGAHTVAYLYDTTDCGNVNLDNLTVSASTNTPAGPGEAEGAFLSGRRDRRHRDPGYTGTGYVTGFDHVGARMIRDRRHGFGRYRDGDHAVRQQQRREPGARGLGRRAGRRAASPCRRGPAGARRPFRCRCARALNTLGS